MSTKHIVDQGEHLSDIADSYGFENFETIWNHPDNAHLREIRESPHVLLEGDEVRVPDKQLTPFARPTGASHTFKVHLHELTLRLRLLGMDDKPLASGPCTLEFDGGSRQTTIDGDGQAEFIVPRGLKTATLTTSNFSCLVSVGGLDPINEQSGWESRLINLGYMDGPLGSADGSELADAISDFQTDAGLTVSGEMDSATANALVDAYGD